MNEHSLRISRGRQIVRLWQHLNYEESTTPRETLIDMMADLFSYCSLKGLKWTDIVSSAEKWGLEEQMANGTPNEFKPIGEWLPELMKSYDGTALDGGCVVDPFPFVIKFAADADGGPEHLLHLLTGYGVTLRNNQTEVASGLIVKCEGDILHIQLWDRNAEDWVGPTTQFAMGSDFNEVIYL